LLQIALPALMKNYLPVVGHPLDLPGAILTSVVYYAESIEPLALTIIHQAPSREWCCGTFLAAQDAEGKSHYMERGSRRRGKVTLHGTLDTRLGQNLFP
jgi:hypothetical protein